jgi:Cys-tRNA(Pro) deacylase
VAPERMFKTLVATVDGRLVLAIVPVSGELDLKRLADALGGRKAELADPAAAERATGYVVGGISPLGLRRPLRAVLDAGAGAHRTIFISAGRRGVQIELAPADLATLARPTGPRSHGTFDRVDTTGSRLPYSARPQQRRPIDRPKPKTPPPTADSCHLAEPRSVDMDRLTLVHRQTGRPQTPRS